MMDVLEKVKRGENVADFNRGELYSTEIITGNAGDIHILRPVDEHGVRDTTRSIRFFSSITVTFRGQPIPVRFEIAATSLSEALAKWKDTAIEEGELFLQRLSSQYTQAQLAGTVSAQHRFPPALNN